MLRDPRPLATLLKVLIILVGIDVAVRTAFVDSLVTPAARRGKVILRDRTQAQAWSRLFATLERAPRADVRIGLFGDSTVYQTSRPGDEFSMAFLLQRTLHAKLAGRTVQVIDFSQIGLYASDSTLLLNRALGRDIDVFVYGVTLRSLPRNPPTRWATTLGSEIGAGELGRLIAAGGGPWLLETFPLENLAAGVAHDAWATYAYRLELRHWVWAHTVHPLVSVSPGLAARLAPLPLYRRPEPEAPRGLALYRWAPEEYAPPNHNWHALSLATRLCARHAPERCLLYTGPLNPESPPELVPTELYASYRTYLQEIATRAGIDFRDYTMLMPPSGFRTRENGRADRIHLSLNGGRMVAQWLAAGITDRLDASAR